MSELLTLQEALQAMIDGKQIRWKYKHTEKWNLLDDHDVTFKDILCNEIELSLVPEMITIGDVSFPKPESEPLEKGTEYWVMNPVCESDTASDSCCWDDDDFDELYLHRGLIHLSQENAIAHAKALIKLSGGKP